MSVYKAINCVQADIAKLGISKKQENTFDNYKFRGIDDVYNALAPIVARHGLCILPRCIKREVQERQSAKGQAIFYVTVEMEYHLISVEDGSRDVVTVPGEAMDRGDKAINKAMSSAYKNFAFQTFIIPTEGDNDTENQTHEVQAQATLAEKIAQAMAEYHDKGDVMAALQEWQDARRWGQDVQLQIWSILKPRSDVRSAIKKAETAAKDAA